MVSPTAVFGKMRSGVRQKTLTGYGVCFFFFLLPSVSPHLFPFFETTCDSVRQCCFKKMAGKISFDRLRVTDHCT